MTKAIRNQFQQEIKDLTTVLSGGEVRGVKLGDPGVSREWAEATRNQLAKWVAEGKVSL